MHCFLEIHRQSCIVMGNFFSTNHIVDRDTIAAYVELSYLTTSEIIYIIQLLEDMDPGKLSANNEYRFSTEQVETILPQIRCSPFRDSIYRVFSSKKDGRFSLADIVDLCSAFSRDCPQDVRAAWAFYIFALLPTPVARKTRTIIAAVILSLEHDSSTSFYTCCGPLKILLSLPNVPRAEVSWNALLMNFDGDNRISVDDLIEAVRRLTWVDQNKRGGIDRREAEHVAHMVLHEMVFNPLGTISSEEFIRFAPRILDFSEMFCLKI